MKHIGACLVNLGQQILVFEHRNDLAFADRVAVVHRYFFQPPHHARRQFDVLRCCAFYAPPRGDVRIDFPARDLDLVGVTGGIVRNRAQEDNQGCRERDAEHREHVEIARWL